MSLLRSLVLVRVAHREAQSARTEKKEHEGNNKAHRKKDDDGPDNKHVLLVDKAVDLHSDVEEEDVENYVQKVEQPAKVSADF